MPLLPMPETRPSTYPFWPDVDQRIRQNSATHVFEATIYPLTGDPIELDVTSVSINFDESWSPYIQADIVAVLIDDQATLDRIDPRLNVRVKITLGYVYDAKERDAHVLADLHLRTRSVLLPSNEIRITAVSDESKLQDRKYWPGTPAPPKTGVNEVIQWATNLGVYPEQADIVSQFGSGYGVAFLTELDQQPGQSLGSIIEDVANRTGTWVRCEGDRRWYITKRSQVAGVSAHKLLTGPDGTIVNAEMVLERQDYANSVLLKYTWQNANNDEVIVYGTAAVPGLGKHGVEAIGFNGYYEERVGPITQYAASTVAQNILTYKITRGQGMRIDAVAAYWLRPGMTVTVQLPTGEQARHIVRAISFNPGNGSMSVTTRQPETL